MSNLNAVRTELLRKEGRHEASGLPRLGTVAVVALLVLGVVVGMAEIHLLPTFSADDFGSILFGAG